MAKISAIGFFLAAGALAMVGPTSASEDSMKAEHSKNPYYSRTDTAKLDVPDATWKKILPEDVYAVAREADTEPAPLPLEQVRRTPGASMAPQLSMTAPSGEQPAFGGGMAPPPAGSEGGGLFGLAARTPKFEPELASQSQSLFLPKRRKQAEQPEQVEQPDAEQRARGLGESHSSTRTAAGVIHRQPWHAPARSVRMATVLW